MPRMPATLQPPLGGAADRFPLLEVSDCTAPVAEAAGAMAAPWLIVDTISTQAKAAGAC